MPIFERYQCHFLPGEQPGVQQANVCPFDDLDKAARWDVSDLHEFGGEEKEVNADVGK